MTTSSDGVLTVTADPTTCSILISATFAALSTPPPAPTINLIPNPNSEAAVSVVALANATVVQSSTIAHLGTFSARATSTATATTSVISPFATSGAAQIGGAIYTASCYVRAAATGRTAQLAIVWYNAAGTNLGSAPGTAASDTTTGWTRLTAQGASPATAAFAALTVSWTSTAASEIHYADSFQLEAGTTLTAYCDGRQAGCVWTGAVDSSVSFRPAYQTMYVRRADGSLVRGLDTVVAPGGILAKGVDHEAPRGVAMVYTAQLSNFVTSYFSTTATATIASDTTTWLKSLRQPALSVQLDVNTPPDWFTDVLLSALYPLSGSYPIAMLGPRRAKTGTLAINTADRTALNALEALLASPGPYLLQFAPNSQEPDRYVVVGATTAHVDVPVATTLDRTVSFPVIEVARPSTAGSTVAYPGHAYANSTATWPLYSGRTGSYGSR